MRAVDEIEPREEMRAGKLRRISIDRARIEAVQGFSASCPYQGKQGKGFLLSVQREQLTRGGRIEDPESAGHQLRASVQGDPGCPVSNAAGGYPMDRDFAGTTSPP